MTTTPLQQLTQSIREQIGQGEIQLALDRLENYLSASAPDLRDEVILLTSRYHRLHRNERKGIITYETAQVEQTKIVNALLDLLEEMPNRISKEMAPSVVAVEETERVPLPDEVRLEKILGVNNLKQISWIEYATHRAKSVCRILGPDGLGSYGMGAQKYGY